MPGKAASGGKPGGRWKRISGTFGNLSMERLEELLPYGTIGIGGKRYGFPKGIVRFAIEQPITTITGILGIEVETAGRIKKEATENGVLSRELLVQIVSERDARKVSLVRGRRLRGHKRKSP